VNHNPHNTMRTAMAFWKLWNRADSGNLIAFDANARASVIRFYANPRRRVMATRQQINVNPWGLVRTLEGV
jgi:hypothetical protein